MANRLPYGLSLYPQHTKKKANLQTDRRWSYFLFIDFIVVSIAFLSLLTSTVGVHTAQAASNAARAPSRWCTGSPVKRSSVKWNEILYPQTGKRRDEIMSVNALDKSALIMSSQTAPTTSVVPTPDSTLFSECVVNIWKTSDLYPDPSNNIQSQQTAAALQ